MHYEDEKAIRERVGKTLRRRLAIVLHWVAIFPLLAILNGIFLTFSNYDYPLLQVLVMGFALLMILAVLVHSVRFIYTEILERSVRMEMERRGIVPMSKLKNTELVQDDDPFEPYIGNDGEFVVSGAPDDYETMRPHLNDTGEFVPDDIDSIRRAQRRKRK